VADYVGSVPGYIIRTQETFAEGQLRSRMTVFESHAARFVTHVRDEWWTRGEVERSPRLARNGVLEISKIEQISW